MPETITLATLNLSKDLIYCQQPVRHLPRLVEELIVRASEGFAEAVLTSEVGQFRVHLSRLALERRL
jgi:hypothetical protein